MMREHRTTLYRQGDSWTVSRWDESVNCYRLSEGKTYWQARAICGEDNRRTPSSTGTGRTKEDAMAKTEKPECQLTGEDGNAFAVIGRVSRALKQAGQPERAKEWTSKAMDCDSYDALLQLAFDYVEVN